MTQKSKKYLKGKELNVNKLHKGTNTKFLDICITPRNPLRLSKFFILECCLYMFLTNLVNQPLLVRGKTL